ncbi:MAG TPA: hypothetical protein PLP88_06615 [Bacteroidales bacterium]|nr:hypothetical protein [Bacteroidales bacterium]
MSKPGRPSKPVKFTVLALLFSIPFLIIDAYILHKPDFSGIAGDSLISSNGRLTLLPACGNMGLKLFYIKQFNKNSWSLQRDGAIPAVGRDVSIRVAYDKIRSCDKKWYGYDCQVLLSNTGSVIAGTADRAERNWSESVKQDPGDVIPGFSFQMPVSGKPGKFTVAASMMIEYPALTKESALYKSNYFINRTDRLFKTYHLQVLPTDMYVRLVNYQQWINRWVKVFLSGMMYLTVLVVIAIAMFSKHR